jgi:hypothetical protein
MTEESVSKEGPGKNRHIFVRVIAWLYRLSAPQKPPVVPFGSPLCSLYACFSPGKDRNNAVLLLFKQASQPGKFFPVAIFLTSFAMKVDTPEGAVWKNPAANYWNALAVAI